MLRELRDWLEELACRAGVDGWPPATRIALSAAAALLVAVAVVRWALPGPVGDADRMPGASGAGASSSREASAAAPAAPATVTVHVVGAVRRPGVYGLPGGSRAADAVAAAGGLLGNAEQAAVNLARVLVDGEQIAVPVVGAQGPVGPGPAGARASGAPAKVDLNTATADQLDALPGVGPATASKIISDRTENGPFRSVDDLLRVPGIGAKKFDALKGLVTVG